MRSKALQDSLFQQIINMPLSGSGKTLSSHSLLSVC